MRCASCGGGDDTQGLAIDGLAGTAADTSATHCSTCAACACAAAALALVRRASRCCWAASRCAATRLGEPPLVCLQGSVCDALVPGQVSVGRGDVVSTVVIHQLCDDTRVFHTE